MRQRSNFGVTGALIATTSITSGVYSSGDAVMLSKTGVWPGSVLPITPTVDYLVVAGGGGGGATPNGTTNRFGGGGGAGGYRSSVTGESSGGGASAESVLSVTPGTPITVTVGGGGAKGTNGNNSV